MKIGDRVVVAIVATERWAKGAPECLNGLHGAIEEIQPVDSIGCGGVLVRFDTPAPKWRRNPTPHRAFWFDPSEVKPEADADAGIK